MTQNLLDKHPGSRRYVAHLHAYGATREQICKKLAEKYPLRAPTPRSMTTWLNGDPELVKMIAELAAIKREIAPDDPKLAELPEPVDQAQVSADLFGMCDDFPAFNRLLHREGERQDDDPDDASFDDVLDVVLADHPTGAEFEADCSRRVGDYEPLAAALAEHLAKHHPHRYADGAA